jgi:hypothetical protein
MAVGHDERELRVFRAFADVMGLKTVGAKIEKRPPPEPDVLYQSPDNEACAYELAELMDESYARLMGQLFRTKNALYEYHKNLSDRQRTEFNRRFGNALLYFRFGNSTTLSQRRGLLSKVFDRLLELPEDTQGIVLKDEFEGMRRGVSISRGNFNGPVFDPESVGSIGDPTKKVLGQKFQKTYQTPHPIELLTFIDQNLMFHDDVWVGNFREFLEAQAKPWPFRRVWAFDLRKRAVKLKFSGV